ncbi:Mor transcription activator family protein [Oryzisolibacter propanilivorax]|nr:Mor transcription activator family protein [Oryzisolibacter propanilivorax]
MSSDVSRALLRRHELYSELMDVMARQLAEVGMASEAAQLVAASMVDFLSGYCAGQVISFPKDERYQLTRKELEAWDMYTGDNVDQIARHFKMTPRGMRKLLRRISDRIKTQRLAIAAPGQLDMLGQTRPELESR